MALSASERIDRILSGKQIHPFDFVNLPLFFDPRPEQGTEYTKRLTDSAKVSYVAANEMAQGLRDKLIFRASGMSNGAAAYDLVNDCTDNQRDNILKLAERRFGKRVKTTQNLKSTVAGSELLNRVILPNRETDFRAGNVLETKFPDKAVVYPIGYENAVRMQKSNNAQSQGASFQDWTFEYWWGPRVIDMAHHVYDGNKRFDSRNLGIEDNLANFIQLGFLDDYRDETVPGKDFPVTDAEGTDVPLADRAWGRAKHVFERTEDGFATDMAIGVLIAEFAMDDWLRGNSKPKGFKLDMDKVHPVLANRSKEELARMDRLKEMMLPYLAEKCMDYLPDYEQDPNLKKYVEDKILPAKKKFKDLDLGEVNNALFCEKIVGDKNSSDYVAKTKKAVSKSFDKASEFISRVTKRRDTEGHYFESPARLFDDRHFEKLSVWQQAALKFVMGAMESFRLPENAPRAMFYIAEPKGGSRAKAFMEKHGIDYLKEAYSAEDVLKGKGKKSFAKNVIEQNKKQMPQDVENLSGLKDVKGRGIWNIVSTGNFINIAGAIEKYRDFVAAKGEQKISPRARLALMMEWMDRNPEAVTFRKDWSVHHDETQMMVRALQIATGLVDRPYNGGNYRMEIFAYDQDKNELAKQDFYDIAMPLFHAVDDMMSKMPAPEAREHYLSAARMVHILDMYMDPGRMNSVDYSRDIETGATNKHEIIHWREVDPALMGFWHDDPQKKAELRSFRDHIRQKLLSVGVLSFEEDDLKGLHEDFRAAWNEAHGVDASLRRREYGDRQTFQKWKGPT